MEEIAFRQGNNKEDTGTPKRSRQVPIARRRRKKRWLTTMKPQPYQVLWTHRHDYDNTATDIEYFSVSVKILQVVLKPRLIK